ncbi:MAG: T9SS type A sorting domain-containing protein [Bacteroidia bacterium]
MKKTILLITLLLSVSFARAQWQMNSLNTVEAICIAAQDTMVCVGSNNYVFVSMDNGNTWLANNTGLPQVSIHDILISNSGIFAGTLMGVYLSTDNGNAWTAINSGLTDSIVFSLAKMDTNVIVGTHHGGVYIYNNNGTWSPVGSGLLNHNVYSLVSDGTTIYAGCDSGKVFKSVNLGTWTLVNSGLPNTDIISLLIHGTVIFAGTLGNGVYMSTDNGLSWNVANNGLMGVTVRTFSTAGINVFAGTENGVYVSNNNASQWTEMNTGITTPFDTIVRSISVSNSYVFIALNLPVPTYQIWSLPISEITEIDEKTNPSNFIQYPNPATDELNIVFNDAAATEAIVEIHDLLGKLIERVPLKSGVAYNYNTQSLQKSIYMVSLYINGKLVDNKKLLLIE